VKNITFILFYCLLSALLGATAASAQTSPVPMSETPGSYPWTQNDLMEPSVLAAALASPLHKLPVILNIGAVDDIKSAKHIGAVSSVENMKTLKSTVEALPKNTAIVIYCGCCPFPKCPNIKPAFLELRNLGFTNVKLLNLPVNLQNNWKAKGYPLTTGSK
jgi:hypothetical protein